MKAVLYQYQESSVVVGPNMGNKKSNSIKTSFSYHSTAKDLFYFYFPTLNQYISYDLTKFLSIHSDTNEGRAKAIGLRRTKDLVWNSKICTSACRHPTKFALNASKGLQSPNLSKWENFTLRTIASNFLISTVKLISATPDNYTELNNDHHKKRFSVMLPVASTVTCCCPVMLRVD